MLKAAGIVLGIAYPLLVYAGLSLFEPRTLAGVLGAAVLVRVVMIARAREGVDLRRVLLAPVAVAGVLAVTAFFNEGRVFLYAPALVNAALLVSFASTLRVGPSMVETFALLQVDEIDEEERRYAVGVTRLWCVFFLLNGLAAFGFALEADVVAWTLYTGLISYLLMGTLFTVEFLYRTWRFRRYVGGPLNPLLRRVFPPRPVGKVATGGKGEDVTRA